MKRSLLPVLVLSLALTAAPLALASEARTQRGRYIVVLEDNTASPSRVAADHATRYGARVSHVSGRR